MGWRTESVRQYRIRLSRGHCSSGVENCAADRVLRYPSHRAEVDQLQDRRVVRTTNPYGGGKTWYSPKRYEDPAEALAELAIKRAPDYRVGPIPADEMPDFDVNGMRVVAPANGQPGGGLEVCTTGEAHIFGCYDFSADTWEDL